MALCCLHGPWGKLGNCFQVQDVWWETHVGAGELLIIHRLWLSGFASPRCSKCATLSNYASQHGNVPLTRNTWKTSVSSAAKKTFLVVWKPLNCRVRLLSLNWGPHYGSEFRQTDSCPQKHTQSTCWCCTFPDLQSLRQFLSFTIFSDS